MDLAHQQRMDRLYAHMKYVYDATRPLFLAGRAALRAAVQPGPGARILEVGCGTGRNLVLLARNWPSATIVGVDISREMLSYARGRIARAGLDGRITLIEGELADAIAGSTCAAPFDYVVFSYSLSMIPDWQGVLRQALPLVKPATGRLLIADFGACEAWPAPLARRLRRNLAYFAVTPRTELVAFLRAERADGNGRVRLAVEARSLFGGYGQLVEVRKEITSG